MHAGPLNESGGFACDPARRHVRQETGQIARADVGLAVADRRCGRPSGLRNDRRPARRPRPRHPGRCPRRGCGRQSSTRPRGAVEQHRPVASPDDAPRGGDHRCAAPAARAPLRGPPATRTLRPPRRTRAAAAQASVVDAAVQKSIARLARLGRLGDLREDSRAIVFGIAFR